MFLTWTLLKTIAKRILSVLPRRLIQDKEQVLLHVRKLRKEKSGHGHRILKRIQVVKRKML
jgi:hypothetical protein